jgi:hypothetical protein
MMPVPEELWSAAVALRRDLERHFAADTCNVPKSDPAHPVMGHHWPVVLVALSELSRRTRMATRIVVRETSGDSHGLIRISWPDGEYDVDLTADCFGGAVSVTITPAKYSIHREQVKPIFAADAYNSGLQLAERAGISLE